MQRTLIENEHHARIRTEAVCVRSDWMMLWLSCPRSSKNSLRLILIWESWWRFNRQKSHRRTAATQQITTNITNQKQRPSLKTIETRSSMWHRLLVSFATTIARNRISSCKNRTIHHQHVLLHMLHEDTRRISVGKGVGDWRPPTRYECV